MAGVSLMNSGAVRSRSAVSKKRAPSALLRRPVESCSCGIFPHQADHTLDKLVFGHFQRENAHGRAFADGGTHGEVEGEGGFAHLQGAPAMMIRSEGWSPRVMASSSG